MRYVKLVLVSLFLSILLSNIVYAKNTLVNFSNSNVLDKIIKVYESFTSNKGLPYEIQKIKSTNNLGEQIKLYRQLIDRVGVEQAQEHLYKSGLPFTGQTHLLNHVAGEYIYEKYGANGLSQCREYFLASCYHGFILDVISTHGMQGVNDVMNECRKSGATILTQCSHALGHGFLAWVGYGNLTGALELCDDTAKTIDKFPSFNCRDGVFMENVWALHSGETSPYRWVNQSDPFYPCNDLRIDPKDLDGCWSNQPALMYQMSRGNITKVGEKCLQVENSTLQRWCFNGLSRQIHPLTKGNVNSAVQLCSLLPSKWVYYCLNTISISDFSVGGRDLSFKICAGINSKAKDDCYRGLYGVMFVYSNSKVQYNDWCKLVLEKNRQEDCENYFH